MIVIYDTDSYFLPVIVDNIFTFLCVASLSFFFPIDKLDGYRNRYLCLECLLEDRIIFDIYFMVKSDKLGGYLQSKITCQVAGIVVTSTSSSALLAALGLATRSLTRRRFLFVNS